MRVGVVFRFTNEYGQTKTQRVKVEVDTKELLYLGASGIKDIVVTNLEHGIVDLLGEEFVAKLKKENTPQPPEVVTLDPAVARSPYNFKKG